MVKAARLHKVGEPLKVEDVPKPKVGKDEVLLKIKMAGVCHSDVHVIDGNIPSSPPLTLGHEIAGEIEELGSGVEDFTKGDRAVVHFLSPCGSCEYCLSGNGMTCENLFKRPGYGFSADGGYSEYCKVHKNNLVRLPDMPMDFAATLGCAGITAYHAINQSGKVGLSDTVAIYGVGGVGMYALQIAKLSGAQVIGIGRSEEKLRMAEELGADYTVNASKVKVKDEVRKVTNGKGADVILDFVVTDESLKNSTGSLANGGRIVVVGASNKPVSLNPQMLVFRELSLAGSLVGNKDELGNLVQLAAARRLKSVVTNKFSLDQVNDAIASLRKGETVGRSCIEF